MALCLGLLGLLYTKTDLSPLGVIVSLVLCLLPAALGSIVTSLFRWRELPDRSALLL